ncbi:MAG TPA: hypothetical protein VGW78_00830 [Candidatus Babeliales bacterium]|jgi:hypothetical protein|nr:hypothetical protein [Candidatus Babeliales bacterium]
MAAKSYTTKIDLVIALVLMIISSGKFNGMDLTNVAEVQSPSMLCNIEDKKMQMITLENNQLCKLNIALSEVSNNSLGVYCNYQDRGILTISKEMLFELNTPGDLKNLFEKNQIMTKPRTPCPKLSPWSHEQWDTAYYTLIDQLEDIPKTVPKGQKVNLEQFSGRLIDIKQILKSFLPTNDIIPLEDSFLIKDDPFSRLLTYFRLQLVIKKKNLSHVFLPLKLLVVRDRITRKYMEYQEALSFLDNTIKKTCTQLMFLEVMVEYCPDSSDNYDLLVLAKKQTRYKTTLTKEAFADLQELIKEAPFDVGYANIFSDVNGNAIIVDTEFKGEPATTSITKLKQRYKTNE